MMLNDTGGSMELPEITNRQIWCCENGCGACNPVQIDFEYSRTEDMVGNLIESKTEKVWASDCCKAELLLWDEDKQDVVEWETAAYIKKEAT